MSLRQVWWAACERKRVQGELLAVQLCFLARRIFGERVEIQDLNPYRRKEKPRPKSPEQIERESALAWQLLDRYFCEK